MGSINYFGNDPPGDGIGKPTWLGNFPLTRQSSIYSLTFDEFQNALGGVGKDFGSMNMDELLKNIWSAEETQSMTTPVAPAPSGVGSHEGGNQRGGYLQRQGSLTLPRTISQMRVDDVWKDITKEYNGGGSNVPQRQQTLGEMTLEEFLAKAGVVREDAQPFGKPNLVCNEIFRDLGLPSNNGVSGFGINFQQPNQGVDLMGNHINMMPTNLPLNVNGAQTPQQQATQIQQQLVIPQQQATQIQQQLVPQVVQQQPKQQRQQPLYPKPAVSYGIVGIRDSRLKNNLMANSVMQGRGGAVGVPSGSPPTSNDDNSSVSPVPYVYHGGVRGRKSGNVEKAVERRQKRMIKNRESAARSRARKQAYTMELEQDIAKLKEENQELRDKQAKILEKRKNQALEMMNAQSGPRKRLRRTQTGMW